MTHTNHVLFMKALSLALDLVQGKYGKVHSNFQIKPCLVLFYLLCEHIFKMHDTQIQIHPLIHKIIQVYYKFGVWQNKDVKFSRKIGRIIVFLFWVQLVL